MGYLLELTSEIIFILIAIVLISFWKKEDIKHEQFPDTIITIFIIEIPSFIITIFNITMKIPHSSFRHFITTAVFVMIAFIYYFVKKKNSN